MSPSSQSRTSGSRCANARAMLVPQSRPCLAVWRAERKGSTAGPTIAAQYAPRHRLRQVGI
eukprot:9035807-Lingulodinium_polyedra.AAC.1